jgi:hypothetical protein
MAYLIKLLAGVRVQTAAGNDIDLEGSPGDDYVILHVNSVTPDADEFAVNPSDARMLARALLEMADRLEGV